MTTEVTTVEGTSTVNVNELPAGTQAAPATPPAVPAGTTPEAKPAAKTEPDAATWAETGDTLVDTIAGQYLANGGNVEQFNALLDDVAATGKLTNAARVELEAKFGPMAQALIPSIEARAAENLAWVQKEEKAVYDAVGGKDKFGEMQAWSKANLDQVTRDFLNSSLEKGGQNAQLAIEQLKQLMIKGGATVTGTTHKVEAPAGDTTEELTLQAYINQRHALERKGDKAGVEALQAKARVAQAAATKAGRHWR